MKPLSDLPPPQWPGTSEAKALAPLGSQLSEQDRLFVELYRQTGDAMASAVRAKMFSPDYPTDVLAMKTLERPEIQAAIAALDEAERAPQVPTAPKAPVTVTRETVTANLQEVYERALPAGAFGAAIASQKTIASLNGWLKQTVDVNIGFKRAEDMTDEELDRVIRGGAKRQMEGEYKDVTPEDDE